MSLLTDHFPTAVLIDDEEVPINSDFRTGLRIMAAYEDDDLADREKLAIMLELLYDEVPANTGEAIRLAVKFLDCGSEQSNEEAAAPDEGRLLSFTQDAQYIYSAFRQAHGVDLNKDDLHWWEFCFLLRDLAPDCFLYRIINLRRAKRTGKMTKEEREYYYRIQDIVDLPQRMTAEDKEFERLLRGG